MNLLDIAARFSPGQAGEEMHRLMRALYPLCRSMTGDGVRQTLRMLQQRLPLDIVEVPSGTRVFDWTVPREWNIREAWIKDEQGRKVMDLADSNLHVAAYSRPVRQRLPWTELKPHIFSLPEHPDWIPYRTLYYEDAWAFCLAHRQLAALPEAVYEVCIDASLEDGSLTYGELFLPGERNDEVLISCHVCHPSLCNDNLSGIVVAAWLAGRLMAVTRRYSYRFLFVPATIGPLAWLARHEAQLPRIKHGLVLAGVGDAGAPTYKRSRRGNAEMDRAMAQALQQRGGPCSIQDFSPCGYDERQYGSPGFDLPVGCLMRTPWGQYPEYHTSADSLDFVNPAALADSCLLVANALAILEDNRSFLNLCPKGEPQLDRRGLYEKANDPATAASRMALLWTLNLSDGRHSLLDIAERSSLAFGLIRQASERLSRQHLLKPLEET